MKARGSLGSVRRGRRHGSALAFVAALGTLHVASCAGRSQSHEQHGSSGGSSAGGTGGATGGVGAGATGGSLGKAGSFVGPEGGGAGNLPGNGGKGASGGNGATGGVSGDAGTGGASGFPCLGGSQASPDLVSCNGGFAHRPSAAACPPPPPDLDPGAAGQGAGGEGGAPTECSGEICEPGEACVWSDPGENHRSSCARVCETDDDCAPGSLCACVPGMFRTPFDPSSGVTVGLCTPSTCTVDADCGPGSSCIAPFTPSDCDVLWPHAFHCQTPEDECASIADCNDEDCVFSGERFVCSGEAAEHC